MIDIMSWDDWINLTDAEQEAVRQRYERTDSEALPGSLSVEEQRRLLEELTKEILDLAGRLRASADADQTQELKMVMRRVATDLDRLAAQPQTPADVVQHIAWLQQYIIGMDESNWKDMRLRAERQLEQISRDLDTLYASGRSRKWRNA